MDAVEERETHTCLTAIAVPDMLTSMACEECGIRVYLGILFYHCNLCHDEHHNRYFENEIYCQNCILKKVEFKTWEVATTCMGITTYKTLGGIDYWNERCRYNLARVTKIPYHIVAPRVTVKSARK